MADGKELRLITFRVGPETFVLDIMAVRQIVPYSGSTSVPTAPSFVEGIVVLRNEVIPIIGKTGVSVDTVSVAWPVESSVPDPSAVAPS